MSTYIFEDRILFYLLSNIYPIWSPFLIDFYSRPTYGQFLMTSESARLILENFSPEKNLNRVLFLQDFSHRKNLSVKSFETLWRIFVQVLIDFHRLNLVLDRFKQLFLSYEQRLHSQKAFLTHRIFDVGQKTSGWEALRCKVSSIEFWGTFFLSSCLT